MRLLNHVAAVFLFTACIWAQSAQLTTAAQVLDRYKQALGGAKAIQAVQSLTVCGEMQRTGMAGHATFVYRAKPFKTLLKLNRPEGTEVTTGFDGKISWTVTAAGAEVDKDTPLDAVRRDADLQYPLHQADYFKTLEFAGVSDFEGHRCYWLHGITNWGKDNNQFYDIATGLLVGYRFQNDASKATTIALFENYKNFGGRLMATRNTNRSGAQSQIFTYESVSDEPIDDSLFELPPAVKVLVK